MNWPLIIFGLVALSSAAFAKDSYLVIVPKLLKVNYENQFSVFIASTSQPVEVKFDLVLGSKRLEGKTICKPEETRNASMILPAEFPIGVAELTITGTGGLQFQERRDVIVYDNRHAILVQTSASTYRPGDVMEIRVIATTEELMPLESGLLDIEIYDAALKLVREFPHVPIRSGLTGILRFSIGEDVNVGGWLVSATLGNTTSSVEVLVTRPVSPSFDLKAIFQRFLLRTDKVLRGAIEMSDDQNEPIFGRGLIAIGQMTEEEYDAARKHGPPSEEDEKKTEEWRKWKSQKVEITGRVELNYDLLSTFDIDLSKALAVRVYIEVTDLLSGQERVIRHLIPVFSRDVIYEIRPLQFEAGIKNEYSVMSKRPDGKPIQMEDVIVTVRMILGDEQGEKPEEKVVEIKDFYTRGRNDMSLFSIDFPENCIGVLMTVTPVGSDGKVHGYRTVTIPMMPTPRRSAAKLSIELLPSTVAPANIDVNVPVVSSQLSTVGRISNFYIQLIPSKPVQKFERLPMSYVLMTNGRITRTGEFHIAPSKECQGKSTRAMKSEEQMPPTCVFNGTLPIPITFDMVPYSTLLVYTFQPSFGFNVAETYRFSVAGLFRQSLTLNATIVPYIASETADEDIKFIPEGPTNSIPIFDNAHDKSRVELSFTGTPESTVGLNVFEFDGVFQGLSNEITKERVLQYLTTYEQVPIVSMPTMPTSESHVRRQRQVASGPGMMRPDAGMAGDRGNMGGHPSMVRRGMSEEDERQQYDRERKGYEARYPVEKMVFGVHTEHTLLPVEGDDIYVSSKMGRLYEDVQHQELLAPQHGRELENTNNQFDVTVNGNDYVLATSVPLAFAKSTPLKPMPTKDENESIYERSSEFGARKWYEQMNSKLNSFTPEAFKFMQSGLSIVSDFDSLRIPAEMKRENLSNLFDKFRSQSAVLLERPTLSVRDEARELLEGYISELDLSLVPPPIMFEEQSRTGYYRSIFFKTSRIESQGTGKVVLPKTKPYSTWMATGFALNAKSGLSIAQPIRLPTNQGLFVLGNCAKRAQIGEHVLLTFSINNYLEKEISNVMFRIRPSDNFDVVEQSKPETVVSSKDKGYTLIIPSMKPFAVETHNLVLIPKRLYSFQIILEVQSQFGGDYEILEMFATKNTIGFRQSQTNLYVLTNEKKNVGPIIEQIEEPSILRSVTLLISGIFFDGSLPLEIMTMKFFVGIDKTLASLYRTLAFRRYLNETSQIKTYNFNFNRAVDTASRDYQALQSYNDYDGSYSFTATEGTHRSSLYLTSLAFGAMISPMMPIRDLVTLNRTLSWILSRQQEDGSFDDNGPCFHYRFCADEYRRESLTAIVLYSLTRDNSSIYMPEFLYRRLFDGENSPVMRAQRYLESRIPEMKSNLVVISLCELAFIQNNKLSAELREKIHQTLLARQLTVEPKDDSKYLKLIDDKTTFEDQVLVNSINVFLYSYFGDLQTAVDMLRWVGQQLDVHPHTETVLDSIFHNDAWYKLQTLLHKQFPLDKVDITIDISTDNGQKKELKINSSNIDGLQSISFAVPFRQLIYSIRGFGFCTIKIEKNFSEEPQKSIPPTPFKLSQEFQSMPSLNEIKAKTCVTYTSTTQNQQLIKNTLNRTIVVEIELPSGMRLDVRQLAFSFDRVQNIMKFDYNPDFNKLNIFLNVPSNMYDKEICLEWALERLSSIVNWAPISIRVYNYLQPETEFFQLIPIHFQSNDLGYSFVDAVHKARPTLSSLPL